MNKTFALLAVAAAALVAGSAQAYTTFNGVDANGAETVLALTPNASAAEAAFRSNLVGTGTETFESLAIGDSAPLSLSFGIAGTATLTGGSGRVRGNSSNQTNTFGRYSVPGGNRFWEVTAGGENTFVVSFSQDVAAFGFYGIDIGDFEGTLSLEFLNGTGGVIGTQNVNAAAGGVANASVLYFGVLAAGDAELFRGVRFVTTGGIGSSDVFAFDSFTIAAKEQV
ncbi:MAG: hypothetical protein LH480_10870, partial [Rubrivivax sp.]|nr:hypothetical protein [Rubrivivax sp.]